MATVAHAPVGTIALLFTDIEGSTRLATELGPDWPAVLADHHALVGGAIREAGGFVESTEGDAFFATFADASAAARAAVTALRRLRSHDWPPRIGELKVRMGLHVGYVERTTTGYVGLEVHRAARVAAAAHGGQLLMTSAARTLVGDQLVSEPLGAHRLKDFPVPELLFCAVVDGRGASSFPPPRTQQVRPTNLPAGTPVLIGREVELDRIRDAFLTDGERVVTLTGRGGAGKTSLALAAAASLLDEHPGGVWLTRLASVTSPEDVLPTVAGMVGAKGDGDDSPLQAIVDRFSATGEALIVLDNLEHLLGAVPAIAELVDAAPNVRLLVTSQAPLRMAHERCLAVDALGEQAAIALITRVARRRDASFALAERDRGVLGEIVSMLDGLPLALELAAARLRVLTPTILRDRLRESSDVLRDDMRDRTDRHRSLRATVDWTLGLVDPTALDLFVRMGAFAGPVELDELELVVGADGLDVLEALSVLVDVALVRRVESGDGRVRFGLPEALRQIAAAMLDDAPGGERWRREHALRQKELQWANRNLGVPWAVREAALAGDAEAAAAVRWARASGDPLAAPLAAAYAGFLVSSDRVREGLALLEPVLDPPPGDPEVYGRALLAYARGLGATGRLGEALAAADAAVALFRDHASRVTALTARGLAYLRLGEIELGLRDHTEATAIARGLGPEALGAALHFESQARMEAGQLELAASLLDEAELVLADVDAPHLFARHTFDGDLALLQDRPRDALQHYARALEHAQELRNNAQVYNELIGIADALALARDDAGALEVSAIAEAQITEMGGSRDTAWHVQGRDLVLDSRDRLGPEAAAQARRRGLDVAPGFRVTRAAELARKARERTPSARS